MTKFGTAKAEITDVEGIVFCPFYICSDQKHLDIKSAGKKHRVSIESIINYLKNVQKAS